MIYKIPKGQHRSRPTTFNLHVGVTSVRKKVRFHKSCIYELPYPASLQINKLFGLGKLYHHLDSARFGWRYAEDGMISLFAYSYYKGKRYLKPFDPIYKTQEIHLAKIPVETEISLEIRAEKDKYEFYIDNIVCATTPSGIPFNLMYELYPYFGGKEPPTQEILITMINETIHK